MKLFTSRAFMRRRHPLSWKRRWRILLLDWLGREEPAERVAAAIALGVGVGFSPFLGLHFVLALALAYLFGLNRLDAVLGQFVGNPWTLPPVLAVGYQFGRILLGSRARQVPRLKWDVLSESGSTWILHPIETARAVFGGHGLLPRLEAYLLGTTLLSIAIGFATYFLIRAVLLLVHRRHPRVAERAARRRRGLIHRRESRETPPSSR